MDFIAQGGAAPVPETPSHAGPEPPLPACVQARLDANRGGASVGELAELGLDRYAVRALVQAKTLVRVRRDAVVDGAAWRSSTPTGRHALRARAVMRSVDPQGDGPLALSHHSALAVQGVPVFGVDQRVHLIRTDGRRGHSSPNTLVHAPVDQDQVYRHDGLRVVRPARAALQVACSAGVEAGLVSADAVLHESLATPPDLVAALSSGGYGRGVAAARLVAQLADPRIESPGESRLRWLLRALGFPDPVPQGRIVDRSGRFVARVDFLFAGAWVVVEFDGRIKYDERDDLWQEKLREDRIRQLGYEVVRLTWRDLENPGRVRALLTQAFARAAARHAV